MLLLDPKSYKIKGNFKRKIPYVTDVVAENYVYPKINKTNIFNNLIQLIKKIEGENDIILVNVRGGEYNNKNGSTNNKEIGKNNDFCLNSNITIKKFSDPNVYKKIANVIDNNLVIILQYYVKIDSHPLNIDVIIDYQNSKKNTQYMLYQKVTDQTNISSYIEKKFGLYNQLMARIETYQMLYYTDNLDINMATTIVVGLIKDLKYLPDFHSNTIDKIKKIAENNSSDIKMKYWNVMLIILYDNISAYLGIALKKYLDQEPKN
jgi:hypothetical protein